MIASSTPTHQFQSRCPAVVGANPLPINQPFHHIYSSHHCRPISPTQSLRMIPSTDDNTAVNTDADAEKRRRFRLYNHRNKKLPLAIIIHLNFFSSLLYAVIVGILSFAKRRDFQFTNSLNSSLLIPVYWTWLLVEAARLYAGQRGVLLDKVPELVVFLLFSVFPQSFAIIYLGFLQESINVWERCMNATMLLVLLVEAVLTCRLLRSISSAKETPARSK